MNNTNMNQIENLLCKCIEITYKESNKYAKIMNICNNPEFNNILRKIHITKLKHCNMFKEIYNNLFNQTYECQNNDFELIGDFKNNLKVCFNQTFKNIDIYRELYFIFDNMPFEKNMVFEIILDEQSISIKSSYMIND